MTVEIQFPIEFLVRGTPVSLQSKTAKSRANWKATVKEASYAALPEGHFWYEGPASLVIYYFPVVDIQGDLDNLIKLIQDALKAHVIKDDKQIERVVAQIFSPDATIVFRTSTPALESAIMSDEPVVYIRFCDHSREDF